MKRWMKAAAAGVLALALAACGAAKQENGVKKIDAQKAKELMAGGSVTVVDVRTAEEYEEAHVPGAVLVPLDTIGAEAPAALPDKKAVLLVYCRSGRRSAQAAAQLAELGYETVYDFGGIIDWPYETETGAAQ